MCRKHAKLTDSQSSLEDYDRGEGLNSVLFWANDNVYKSGTDYNRARVDWGSTVETNPMSDADSTDDDLNVCAKRYKSVDTATIDDKDNGGV